MRKLNLIIIIVLATMFSSIHAQTYHLNGYAGIGYARFITDMDYSGLNKNGFSGTLRIMWQPEHLLRVGLETGYYNLYTFTQDRIETEFGSTDVHSSLRALPVFISWAMQVSSNIEIFIGSGPTFLYTAFDSFGIEAKSTQISTSYIVGGTYTRRITDKIKLGGELKYYRINKIEDGTLTLQFMFVYELLNW